MTDQIIGEWIECVVDKDYEIYSAFPYPIRRKGSDRIIAEWYNKDGYVQCVMNDRKYLKHRVIAQQFIPNPNNLPEIDHINHNRADNRIENLRWCSRSENMRNISVKNGYQYTFIDELPETAEPLEFYGNHEFDGLWIDYASQKLYVETTNKYRELRLNIQKQRWLYYAYDREGKRIMLYHSKLFD